MKNSTYANMTDNKLLKTRNLIKGASIGFGIIYFLVLIVLGYLMTTNGSKDLSVASLVPIFVLPITFVPLLINLSLLNKEIKSRNI